MGILPESLSHGLVKRMRCGVVGLADGLYMNCNQQGNGEQIVQACAFAEAFWL